MARTENEQVLVSYNWSPPTVYTTANSLGHAWNCIQNLTSLMKVLLNIL
jgi:hypothetical protein